MKKKSQQSRSLIMTIVLAASAVGYVVLVFLPGQRAIGEMRRELLGQQNFIVQTERLTFAIQQTENDLAMARGFTKKWKDDAPSQAKLAAMFGRITALAAEADASITKLEPHPIQQRDAIWQMSLTVHVEGYFEQIFDFIGKIEALPMTIWITELSMDSIKHDAASMKELAKSIRRRDTSFQNSKKLSAEITLTVFADKVKNSD